MMKMTTSLVVALALVAGCSKKEEEGTVQRGTPGPAVAPPAPAPTPEPAKPMTATELADMYKACVGHLNAQKFDEFKKSCIADGVTVHDMGGMPETKGADAMMAMFKEQRAAFPDMKLEPQIVAVSGRNVLSVLLMTGTHQGAMKGPSGEMPATNKKVGMLMFHRLAIDESNKASEEWVWMDAATMMNQLGVLAGAPPGRPVMDKGLEGAPITVTTTDDAKEKANIEVVNKRIDAFNARKWADLAALHTADFVMSDQTNAKDAKGVKELETGSKAFIGAFPDAKITIENTWAAGDYVVTTGKLTGTNTGDLGKMKKTGKPVTLEFAEVVQLKDGKIASVWRFHSGMSFAMQLGAMPAMGAPAGGAAAPKGGAAAPAGGAAPAPATGSAAPAAGSAAPATN